MGLQVTADGLDPIVAKSAKFHKNMTEGARAASQTKAYAAAKQESQDYGVTRSLRPGGTGASARDFAQEAQGLGGLVRLYATYAANIFAVGAAFRALSNAMDTSNMVRGLDQLGAASGVALGSLSKRLVQATDGAISLREAMEATAKASSSGMSSENILRMGKVAKQASQALGVDMADAVSRITRGITKLEPELLDEIGIFTKVGTATEEYAKSIGKSAAALTDFERRMAFANAVLEEGERKFNAIEIDTNPYTKLLASVKDVTQSVLEFINKGLAPVVKFLSESPSALLGILVGIGTVLAKQALPAIGQFRASLEDTAEKARQVAVSKAKDAEAAKTRAIAEATKNREALADESLLKAIALQKKLEEETKKSLAKNTTAYKLLNSDFATQTKENLANINSLVAKTEDKIKGLQKAITKGEKAGVSEEELKPLRDKIDLYKQAILISDENIKNEAKLALTAEEASKKSVIYTLNQKIAEKARQDSIKSTIVSNAAYNASISGLTDAYRIMRGEIALSGLQLGIFGKAALYARGAVAILGGAIATVATYISNLFAVVGIFVTAIGLLNSYFSTATKEIDTFNDSIDNTTSATDNLSRTMKTLWDNNPFSVQAVNAQATAMLELSSGLEKLGNTAKEAIDKINQSKYESFVDGIKDIFGFGVEDKFRESLAKSISSAVKDLENSPIATEVKQTLQDILKIENVEDLEAVEAALKKLDAGPASETVKKLIAEIKKTSVATAEAASKAKDFQDSYKKAGEAFQDLQNQYKVNDNLIKYSEASVDALLNLSKAIDGPVSVSIAAMDDLLANLGKRPIFGLEATRNIMRFRDEMSAANKETTDAAKAVTNLQKRLDEASKQEAERQKELQASPAGRKPGDPPVRGNNQAVQIALEDVSKAREDLEAQLVMAKSAQSESEAKVQSLAIKIRGAINTGLSESINNIAASLTAQLAKGSTQVAQSLYSKAADIVPELAAKQFDLKLQELASEANLIKVQQDLTLATQLLAAEMALERAEKDFEKVGSAEGTTAAGREKAAMSVAEAKKNLELLNKAIQDPVGAVRDLNSAIADGNLDMKNYAQSIINTAAQATGFKVALQGIAQQQQLIKLIDKPLEVAQKQYKLDSESAKRKLDSLNTDQKILNQNIELGLVGERQAVIEKEGLARKVEQARYSSELAQIQFDYNNQLIIANGLSKIGKEDDAQKVRSAAETLKTEKEALAVKTNTSNIVAITLNTTKENYQILQKEVQQYQLILDLQQKISDLAFDKLDAEQDLSQARLDRQKDSGQLSDLEYQNAKEILLVEKERRALTKKLKEEEIAYIKIASDLSLKMSGDITDEERQRYKEQLALQYEYFNARISHEEYLSKLRITGISEAIQYEKDARKRELDKALTDSIVTALTKGGKEGAKVLRNFIVEEMRRKITVQVQAQVRTSNIGKVASAATDFTSTVMAGYNSYNFGGGLIDGLNTLGDNLVTVFPELGMKIQDLGVSLGGYESALNTVGVGISALTSALDGDYGAALGEVVGYSVAGPVGAAVGKFLGSALGLTDDSGTYHTGGAGSYSSTQGVRTGASVEQSLNFNLEGNINEQVETASANAAKTLVAIFDGIATTFGQEAGYYAATAFADDTSKDGAWGALMVKLGDKVLIDWGKGVDKWPGREFADGEAGQKEYLNALAKDTVQVLKDMDLPKWADDILASIGDSPTFEKLQVAITQIEALNSVFETFSGALGWTREEIEGMIGPLGGVQSSAQKLGFYYENFYSEQEKLAYSTKSLKDKFSEIGKEMPETREGFRAMVEAAKAAGDEALVAKILNLAPAFANLTPALEDAADSIANLFETAREQLNLTADGLAGIFRNVLDTATSAGEAQSMAAAEFEKSVYTGLQNVMITGVSQMLYDAVIAPMANNLVGASVSAATSVASGGVVSGSAVASGGILAGNELAKIVADAKIYIANMAAIMNDPGVRELISQASGAAGSAAGQMWTATPTQYRPTTTSLSYGGGSNDSSKPEQNAYEKLMEQLVDRLAELNRSIEEANANERTRKGQTAQRLARERESFLASDEYKEAYGIASAENTRKQKLATNYENASSYYKRIADSYSKWGATDAANWMLEYSNLYKEKAASLRLEVANFVDPILAAFDENQRKEIELDTLEERNELTNELTDLMMTGAEATRAWIDGLYESNQELGMQLAVMRELKPLLQEEAGLRVQLARASGNEELAKRLEREIAFQDLLTEEARAQWDRNRALEEEIQNLETLAGLKDEYGSLEIQKLQALGRTQEALALQRQKDIEGMDAASIAQYDRNKALEEEIRIIEVMKEVKNQEVELLRLQGKEEEALALERSLQLAGMDPLLQSNQLLIWQYEDMQIAAEKARQKTEMQVRILELLGRSEEATAISRAMQLAEMDASLRPMQEYIWLLEDEAKAKQELQQALEKEINTLQGVADKTKGFIKSLADLKQSLQVSDVLTPQQRYAEAKRQFFENSALIATVPTTEEGVAAREEALGNFTSLANKLLEESRTVNSSSSLYFEDYTNIMALIDSTSSALEDQLTDTEKMIESMKSQVTLLTGIETAVKSIPDATAALNSIRDKLALAQDYTAMYPEYALPLATTATETAPSVSPTTSTTTTETIPETTNAQLLIELRAVKEELKQLRAQQHKETGDLINATYDSEMRGADKVSTTIVNTAKTTSWTSAVTTGATLA